MLFAKAHTCVGRRKTPSCERRIGNGGKAVFEASRNVAIVTMLSRFL